MILEHIDSPQDLRSLSPEELITLSAEIRGFIVDAVTVTGGHLGSNLGVVELTLALHRTFDSPKDVLLWDTGHQAYVHKLVTGRREAFTHLRQADGLSGYPNRTESEHDWVENSHASTILSYAHGLAACLRAAGQQAPGDRRGRRRGPDRGDGLRGPQQPRPLGHTGGHRAQRQRSLLCAHRVEPLARA